MLCQFRSGVFLWRRHRYKTHKSLDEFCKRCPLNIGERILIYTKDYQKDEVVTSVFAAEVMFIWSWANPN